MLKQFLTKKIDYFWKFSFRKTRRIFLDRDPDQFLPERIQDPEK